MVSDTSETAKINFINSGAVDIIRAAYYIRGLELMKLIFAVSDVSLTMGLTRCYKTEGFFLHLLTVTDILSRTVSDFSQLIVQLSHQRGHFDSKFQVEGVVPQQSFLHR